MTHRPSIPAVRREIVALLATLAMVAAACTATSQSAGPVASGTPAPSVAASPAVAKPSSAIHVLEDPVAWTAVSAGTLTKCASTTGCQGDRIVGRSRLLDATTRSVVGTFFGDCVLVDPDQTIYACAANTMTLTGRGQIVYTETPLCFGSRAASPYCLGPWPIIGGTGEFQGVSGVVTVPADTTWKYGDFVVTFNG